MSSFEFELPCDFGMVQAVYSNMKEQPQNPLVHRMEGIVAIRESLGRPTGTPELIIEACNVVPVKKR